MGLKAMKSVLDIGSLWNFIGYVVLGAPDRFPYRDYLPASEQMNLHRAFEELRNGIQFALNPDSPPGHEQKLKDLLDASFTAYLAGDDFKGAHLLQDFQDCIFKSE